MLNKTINEEFLFELSRNCNNLDNFKKAVNDFERQNNFPLLDENNNPILENLNSTQNAICSLRDSDGRTLLHHCVANYKDQQVLEFLLKNYPQLILTSDYQGLTIIHLAVINGNLNLLKFLCQQSKKLISEPNFILLLQSADNELHSALHWAVVCQEYDCLNILIDTIEKLHLNEIVDKNKESNNLNDVGINIRDIHGSTCLHYASQLSTKTKFFNLLSDGGKFDLINTNYKNYENEKYNSESYLPKMDNNSINNFEEVKTAEKKVSLKILNKILSSKFVRVNCKDNEGRTPLLWAASSGECKAIKELLNAGAEINAQDKDGLTAMHCAASKGNLACIETLFKYGNADINAEDRIGATPLHYAATFGSVDACRLILNYGAFVDSVDFKGRSVMHCAASKGNFLICKSLLEEFDADLWKRNAKGELPLHEAVRSGKKELVKWILSLNPSAVNIANNFGRTCLHLASQTNNIEICKLLIDFDASINALMKQRNFNEQFYHQLDETTKKVYLRNNRKEKFGVSMVTPLDIALQHNYRSCARFLMMNGAYPAAKLGLNNILSKSNPNLIYESNGINPLYDSRESSGNSIYGSNSIYSQNNYNSAQYFQSLISNNFVNTRDDLLNSNTNDTYMEKKPSKYTNKNLSSVKNVYQKQHSANLPDIKHLKVLNSPNELAFLEEKRSRSQPIMLNQNQIPSQHILNNEIIESNNQYTLVQNSSSSSTIIDYPLDENISKSQSIVTNVYLNCNHSKHSIKPLRKKKLKLVKNFSNQKTINTKESQSENNYLVNKKEDETEFLDDSKSITKNDISHETFVCSEKHENNLCEKEFSNDEKESKNIDMNLPSIIKVKDNKKTHSYNKKQESIDINTFNEPKKSQKIPKVIDVSDFENDLSINSSNEMNKQKLEPLIESSNHNNFKYNTLSPTEDSSQKETKCSHHLHFKKDARTVKYSKDYKHVKAKVNSNNVLNNKSTSKLIRSKSNLEDLTLDELDEAGEIIQNAEKSLRKFQTERKLFQELQNLKRYQIRTNQINEAVFVKRLADQFRKETKQPGMTEFWGPYNFKLYEKYLYDQLRKLSSSNEEKVLPLINENEPKSYDFKSKKLKNSCQNLDDFCQQKSYCKICPEDTTRFGYKRKNLVSINKQFDEGNEYVPDENDTLQDISTSFSDEKTISKNHNLKKIKKKSLKNKNFNFPSINKQEDNSNADFFINKKRTNSINKEKIISLENIVQQNQPILAVMTHVDDKNIFSKNNEIINAEAYEKLLIDDKFETDDLEIETKEESKIADNIDSKEGWYVHSIQEIIEDEKNIENQKEDLKSYEILKEEKISEPNYGNNKHDFSFLSRKKLEKTSSLVIESQTDSNLKEIANKKKLSLDSKFNYSKLNQEKIECFLEKHKPINKSFEEKKTKNRRLSNVSFLGLPDGSNLDSEENKRKYAKTPIKQLSFEEQLGLSIELDDDDIIVNNDKVDGSSSSTEDLNKEFSRKEKNELIDVMEKMIIENLHKSDNQKIQKVFNEEYLTKEELKNKDSFCDKNGNYIYLEKVDSIEILNNKNSNLESEKTSETEQKNKIIISNTESLEQIKTLIENENVLENIKKEKIEIKMNEKSVDNNDDKNDKKFLKKSSSKDDCYTNSADKDALIEEVIKNSGYEEIVEPQSDLNYSQKEEKVIPIIIDYSSDNMNKEETLTKNEKNNENDKLNENIINNNTEEKKNFDENINMNDSKHSIDDKKEDSKIIDSLDEKKIYEKESIGSDNNNKNIMTKNDKDNNKNEDNIKNVDIVEKLSTNEENNQEKKNDHHKKADTLVSKIPISSVSTKVKDKFQKNLKEEPKKTNELGEKTTFKRNCLKLTNKTSQSENVISRPKFKRKKSELPKMKYSVNLNEDQIKKKWNEIKSNEKDKLENLNLRRTVSNPTITSQKSNYYDLIYEINKMPQWARTSVANQNLPKNQRKRSNTTNLITQTKRTLEKIEKKETEEIITRTVIDEEELTSNKKIHEEMMKSEKEENETIFYGPECSVCKKIIIPITDEMKFCKKMLRKMHSDSELQVKICCC